MTERHNTTHSGGESCNEASLVTPCYATSDRGGHRTHDLRIKSPLLCQLSYPVRAAGKETSESATVRH